MEMDTERIRRGLILMIVCLSQEPLTLSSKDALIQMEMDLEMTLMTAFQYQVHRGGMHWVARIQTKMDGMTCLVR